MRNCIWLAVFLILMPLGVQNVWASDSTSDVQGVLIRNITIDGFVLGDKDRFLKLFKPYSNKHLTTSDMDDILQKIEIIYEREGYKELVSINYQVIKHLLKFTVLMTS